MHPNLVSQTPYEGRRNEPASFDLDYPGHSLGGIFNLLRDTPLALPMSERIVLPYNWKPRSYQRPLWNTMELGVDGKKGGVRRAAVVWHRRAGKDLFGINFTASRAIERVGLYWHLFPTYNQGRKIAWEGFTKEGRRFLDHFPKALIEGQNDTEMRLKLKNGSIYQVVGTDSVDRLVGSNPVGCIFSEYSVSDPGAWDLIQPILAENGGWAIFIYTPRGLNHGWKLFEMAQQTPGWYAQLLTVSDTKRDDGTPVVSEQIIAEIRASGMPEEKIQQEFYCSFEAPLVGAYYSKQMQEAAKGSRITTVAHVPSLPVHTAWDLGYNDAMTIWFWQEVANEIHFIDYIEASGEGLAYYISELKKKPYTYGRHKAPHDIEVTELGTGKSRREVARSLGLRFDTVPKHDVLDGIESCRNILPRCWFDKVKCKRGIEALKSYTKAWDDKSESYRDSPVHNWASHGADSFRTFAWSHKDKRRLSDEDMERNQRQETEYDIYG